MPNGGVPNEEALDPKAGLSSFPPSTENVELESAPAFVPNFVENTLVLDPAEPRTELEEIEEDALGPVRKDSVVATLLAGFTEGTEPEDPNRTPGFATDGVANEKDDAALGGLLFVNLNTLGDEALDGEGPNGDPMAALEIEFTVAVGVVAAVVLEGGGPNRDANAGTDFSANDDALLGDALFESGRPSPDCCSNEVADAWENPLEMDAPLFSEEDMDGEGLELAERA